MRRMGRARVSTRIGVFSFGVVALLAFAWPRAAAFERVDRRAAPESPNRKRSTSRDMPRIEATGSPAPADREDA